jgi:hypothetical protein
MALTRTQKAIIREIRALHARREPLNISAVKRSHPNLIKRVYAVRPYWGWKRALEDAGLDYKKINVELLDYVDCKICGRDFGALVYHLISQHQISTEDYRCEYPDAELVCETVRAGMGQWRAEKRLILPRWESIWSAEHVLDRMAELRRRNCPMHFGWTSEHEPALAAQVAYYFGSWDEALRRIGLDPRQIRLAQPTEHLTREEVIARLSKRREEGLGVNFRAVQQEDSPLATAIRKYFHSHDRALREAGADPARVRKLKTYGPSAIGACLRDARRIAKLRGEAHREAWLRFSRKYFNMVNTGRLGGWKGIARRSGVPLERLVWKKFRNREDVMAALRERVKLGKSLQAQRILEQDLSLRTAVVKYLGDFEAVYREFDIQPPRESPWRRADKGTIVAELNRRAGRGEALSWKTIVHDESGPAFLNRATELYGKWSGALAAAGLDPFGGAKSPWRKATKNAVLAEIRRRKRVGESVYFKDVERDKWGQALLLRGKELFGSWGNALRRVGMEPLIEASRWAYAIRSDIVAEMRRRQKLGESLRTIDILKEKSGRALLDRATKLFGGLNAAQRAAGIEPAKENSPWPRASEAEILSEIRRRDRAGESLQTTKIEAEKWGNPFMNRCRTLFGSWTGAVLAAGVAPPPGLTSPWVKAKRPDILSEIRRRKRAGETLRVADIEDEEWGTPLLYRVRTLFGSWNAALVAAGIKPMTPMRSPWADAGKEEILAEIRRRTRAKKSLRYKHVESEHWGKPLVRRASRLFGSWNTALSSAKKTRQ